MCLRVNAKGIDTGISVAGLFSATHVSVYVHLLKGEHDEKLKWPFQGNITVELVNQKRDLQHVEYDIYFGGGSGARVFKAQFPMTGPGIGKFISHTALETTTGTTQYLHNDSLRWRVTKILYSV